MHLCFMKRNNISDAKCCHSWQMMYAFTIYRFLRPVARSMSGHSVDLCVLVLIQMLQNFVINKVCQGKMCCRTCDVMTKKTIKNALFYLLFCLGELKFQNVLSDLFILVLYFFYFLKDSVQNLCVMRHIIGADIV